MPGSYWDNCHEDDAGRLFKCTVVRCGSSIPSFTYKFFIAVAHHPIASPPPPLLALLLTLLSLMLQT